MKNGTPNNGTSYPYYSHTTPIRIPKDIGNRNGMGIVCEAYHKGVPLLGVPGITLEITSNMLKSHGTITFPHLLGWRVCHRPPGEMWDNSDNDNISHQTGKGKTCFKSALR